MSQFVTFYQGLYCLLRLNWARNTICFEIITYTPSIYKTNHPGFYCMQPLWKISFVWKVRKYILVVLYFCRWIITLVLHQMQVIGSVIKHLHRFSYICTRIQSDEHVSCDWMSSNAKLQDSLLLWTLSDCYW